MADASPRTDISTDVETDDKNQRVMLCLPPLLKYYFLPFNYVNYNFYFYFFIKFFVK